MKLPSPVRGVRIACAAFLMVGSAAAAASPSSATPPHAAAPTLFERHDLWFGLAAGALVVTAAYNDRWLTQETREGASPGEHRLSSAFKPLGSLAYVAPVLGASWLGARVTGHDAFARAAFRVGVSTVAAGLVTSGIKLGVGRARPNQDAADAMNFRPFSGHESFPSGHTTIAFALASALDRETSSRWVPWVAYPAAAVVGWSRVHDEKHWTSDVIAGAAIGAWVGARVDDRLRWRDGRGSLGVGVTPDGRAPAVALTFKF